MNSGGGKRGRGGGGGGRGGSWGRGGYAPWKRGRGNSRGKPRGAGNTNNFMAPPSQALGNADFDADDADGRLSQTPQFQGAAQTNNVGKLIQTQLTFEAGDCFPGWDLYFPTTAYDDSAPTVATIKVLIKYFQTWSAQYTTVIEKVLRDRFVEIFCR